MPSLNESQRRSILSSFLDIHHRMAEMEAMIAQGTIRSPFSGYVNDLSPSESKVVEDYFARIRSAMLARLREAGIRLEVRRTSLRWSLQVGLTFLNIAVAEMGPTQMQGYGPLGADGRETVVNTQQDLDRLIDRVGAYLRQGLGRDLPERLARLESTAGAATLTLLDRVISRWQLVEFRPSLDAIVQRLEAPQFEIAVFGRVSSGKSSLLNHIAGMDVLPVGVTPITAVPTRLVRGDAPAALVSFAELQPRRIEVGDLRDYASEEGNPGNRKHVTNIEVRLPSPRLREGVVLVDTPGIGSLALSGSAETLAYLPRCDLAVVLIDASSALNQDDLDVLRTLYEAGIPAQVLLSKADLLTPADRRRLADYIREHLRRELGLDLPVHPVSTVGPHEALLTEWFEQEIAPLFDRHRALTEASLRRKVAHLRESVAAVLQTLLARQQGGQPPHQTADLREARRLLDEADAAIRQAEARCRDWRADQAALLELILRDAARAVVAGPGTPHKPDAPARGPTAPGDGPVLNAVRQVLVERGRMAHDLVKELRQTLSRTLEGVQQTAPLANADAGATRNAALGGLPALDLSSLRVGGRRFRPWWASLLPPVAVRATRRALQKRLGPALRDYVELYDGQLRAWVRTGIAGLVDLYESQAEALREQVRRLTSTADGTEPATGSGELLADLQELQGAELPAEPGESHRPTPSHPPS
jgi:GTP-binding protein EngB required for normal cell division